MGRCAAGRPTAAPPLALLLALAVSWPLHAAALAPGSTEDLSGVLKPRRGFWHRGLRETEGSSTVEASGRHCRCCCLLASRTYLRPV